MTYVIGTQVQASDPVAMRENIAGLVRPKLVAAGAAYVDGHETMVGGNSGEFTVGSRWDSVDNGLAALAAFYQDPDVIAALEAAPAQVVGRAVGAVEGEAGTTTGSFAFLVAAMMATPDPSRTGDLVGDMNSQLTAHGCNGVRLIRTVVAGEATGGWVTVVYTDSIDAALKAVATTYTNEAMMGHFAALGITITGRTIAASL